MSEPRNLVQNRLSLAVVVGARPNFVKAAPLLRRLKDSSVFSFKIIHTGQHYDDEMSGAFFRQLGIQKPDYILTSQEGGKAFELGKVIAGLSAAFRQFNCVGVIVFGDVNSTLAAGIAAKKGDFQKGGFPLFHIEAGLRSYDSRMPEETNRVIVDHLSDLCFTTEPSGDQNLLNEGVLESRVKRVGNLMIENLLNSEQVIAQSQVLKDLSLEGKGYIVATVHRKENVSDRTILFKILQVLSEVAKEYSIVFPVHPGTKKIIEGSGFSSHLHKFICTSPAKYADFIALVKSSKGVISDSGGVQEEASFLGIPCCTIRDNTERPVTLQMGTNRLFPLAQLNSEEVLKHLKDSHLDKNPIPLWDAEVSARIVKELEQFYKRRLMANAVSQLEGNALKQ